MTPAARIAAAIEILDRNLSGIPAEQALTGWARGHRFAGSGDRAAIRDHVFDALRCRRSFAALGGRAGRPTGRALMIGALRAAGVDPATIFTGEGHAPPPLTPAELRPDEMTETEALDCPDWLAAPLRQSLGADFASVMELLRHRAPVFLRVNLARIDRDAAQARLAAEGVATEPHPLAATALRVTEGAARLRRTAAYAEGLVELQDAASQAVVEMLPLADGQCVLDYCAGGGGKTLAMAARARLELCAHDAAPQRMADLPARAARAGQRVAILAGADLPARGPFDLVLLDVPCSGSGSWRRAPEGKWLLDRPRLAELLALQAQILDDAAPLVRPGGHLAYATCSMLAAENGAQVAAFLDRQSGRPGWHLVAQRDFTPLVGGDGFHCSVLRAPAA